MSKIEPLYYSLKRSHTLEMYRSLKMQRLRLELAADMAIFPSNLCVPGEGTPLILAGNERYNATAKTALVLPAIKK